MSKNFKIFDFIIYSGNLDFLRLRILEFQDIVDYFIIIPESENIELNLPLEILEKISTFNTYKDVTLLYQEIKDFVGSKYLSFDDLIFISKEHDLPDFNNILEIVEETKNRNVVLKHKTLCWNVDYYLNEQFTGSYVFNFSHFLTNLNILKNLWKIQSDSYESNFEKKLCGWKFVNFHEPNQNEIFARENLIPDVIYNPATTYKLEKVDDNFELPKNIGILAYHKIGREHMKKHLFLVESDKDVNLNEIRKIYDTVSVIEFSDSVNEMIAENIGESVSKSILYLPKNILYGENQIKEFQEDYKKNEIKRIIETVFPQDQDSIRIIYRGFVDITFQWESIKNENFSKIINPS